MSAPAVSVIMNCLNSARDLRAALDSLMAQTFGNFEVIFWDNGSTDDSPAIAQSYGPKLRYFRGETTVPLGAARNLALMRARPLPGFSGLRRSLAAAQAGNAGGPVRGRSPGGLGLYGYGDL